MRKVLLKRGIYYDIFRDSYVFKRQKVDINELPLSVGLQLTRNCNLSCVHCSDFQKIESKPLRDIKKILDILRSSGLKRVTFTGGEPFLRKDLVEILKHAKRKNFVITIITNGTLLDKKRVKELKPYIDNIRVSLHGLEKYHDRFVGVKGAFKKSVEGVRLCKLNNIPVCIVSSLVLSNISKLEELAELICRKLKVNKWRIFTLIARGKARKIFDKEFIHAHEIKDFFGDLLRQKKENNWFTEISIKNWRIEGRCLLILPNGLLIGVPSFKNRENQYVAGNILTDDLKLMWEKYPHKENYWQAKKEDFYKYNS